MRNRNNNIAMPPPPPPPPVGVGSAPANPSTCSMYLALDCDARSWPPAPRSAHWDAQACEITVNIYIMMMMR